MVDREWIGFIEWMFTRGKRGRGRQKGRKDSIKNKKMSGKEWEKSFINKRRKVKTNIKVKKIEILKPKEVKCGGKKREIDEITKRKEKKKFIEFIEWKKGQSR